jgi:hypothetical protein
VRKYEGREGTAGAVGVRRQKEERKDSELREKFVFFNVISGGRVARNAYGYARV